MVDDRWLAQLVCPISGERVNENVVRVTALLVAMLSLTFLITKAFWMPLLLIVDFSVRGFGWRTVSPLARLAQLFVRLSGRTPRMIDFAPKEFAARIGFVFSVGLLVAHSSSASWAPTVASLIAAVLTLFALLEALANFCAGCVVYTYVMLPLVRRGSRAAR